VSELQQEQAEQNGVKQSATPSVESDNDDDDDDTNETTNAKSLNGRANFSGLADDTESNHDQVAGKYN
jgi:hypothetical protein